MNVRPATAADLDSIRAIASSYGNLETWPDRPDYIDHELATGILAVSEEGGEVSGFGGVFSRTGVAHLADLFIRRDRLGRGLGRALLDEILPPTGERVTFASRDPRALPLYARFGMSPVAPLLYMQGSPAEAARLPDPGLRLVEVPAESLTDRDRDASGRSRPQDLEFMRLAGARTFLLFRDSAEVGYGVCRLAGVGQAFVGPAGVASPADAAAAASCLVRFAAQEAAKVMIPVIGPNPALGVLLSVGFRVEDMDTLMVSREGLFDAGRYFPSFELG